MVNEADGGKPAGEQRNIEVVGKIPTIGGRVSLFRDNDAGISVLNISRMRLPDHPPSSIANATSVSPKICMRWQKRLKIARQARPILHAVKSPSWQEFWLVIKERARSFFASKLSL